ncbi:MAG: response regulator transcription factor [Bacteroidaceae bacterium]|nr:response regulator transcription factor [Bacteroidaceae bacterium]
MNNAFNVIIVEDARLELKGTEEIFRTDIPEATIIGVAANENELDALLEKQVPDLLLLDLGLGGSTTVGVEICAKVKKAYPQMKVLIFTGELLNEKLWVDVLAAGADGITLKTGELLTKYEIYNVMAGKRNVFNQPILEKIVERFREGVMRDVARQKSLIEYEIDRYDECFLRHLALGYTKEMISSLKTMPFGVKSLEKRQADLVARLFPETEQRGVNVTRLVVRAIELRIIDADNLEADE